MEALPIEEIEIKARGGDAVAQALLVDRLRAIAATGSVAAKRALGQVLLTRPPYRVPEGAAAIFAAADGGDAQGAHFAACLAAGGIGVAQNWPLALRYLQRSADQGWGLAQAQRDLLSEGGADIAAWLAVPQAQTVFSDPRIAIVENFVPRTICDWLITRARPGLERAQILDEGTERQRDDSARTNSAANFNLHKSDVILQVVRARIAAVTGLSPATMEASAVLHYAPGESYRPHFDFLDTGLPGYADDVKARGQRVLTFLLYLNDDYAGAETDFPHLAWRHRGRAGDAMFFWNVNAAGVPDARTLHAGLPPQRGEKWLFSQWVRDKAGAIFGPVQPEKSVTF